MRNKKRYLRLSFSNQSTTQTSPILTDNAKGQSLSNFSDDCELYFARNKDHVILESVKLLAADVLGESLTIQAPSDLIAAVFFSSDFTYSRYEFDSNRKLVFLGFVCMTNYLIPTYRSKLLCDKGIEN